MGLNWVKPTGAEFLTCQRSALFPSLFYHYKATRTTTNKYRMSPDFWGDFFFKTPLVTQMCVTINPVLCKSLHFFVFC